MSIFGVSNALKALTKRTMETPRASATPGSQVKSSLQTEPTTQEERDRSNVALEQARIASGYLAPTKALRPGFTGDYRDIQSQWTPDIATAIRGPLANSRARYYGATEDQQAARNEAMRLYSEMGRQAMSMTPDERARAEQMAALRGMGQTPSAVMKTAQAEREALLRGMAQAAAARGYQPSTQRGLQYAGAQMGAESSAQVASARAEEMRQMLAAQAGLSGQIRSQDLQGQQMVNAARQGLGGLAASGIAGIRGQDIGRESDYDRQLGVYINALSGERQQELQNMGGYYDTVGNMIGAEQKQELLPIMAMGQGVSDVYGTRRQDMMDDRQRIAFNNDIIRRNNDLMKQYITGGLTAGATIMGGPAGGSIMNMMGMGGGGGQAPAAGSDEMRKSIADAFVLGLKGA